MGRLKFVVIARNRSATTSNFCPRSSDSRKFFGDFPGASVIFGFDGGNFDDVAEIYEATNESFQLTGQILSLTR